MPTNTRKNPESSCPPSGSALIPAEHDHEGSGECQVLASTKVSVVGGSVEEGRTAANVKMGKGVGRPARYDIGLGFFHLRWEHVLHDSLLGLEVYNPPHPRAVLRLRLIIVRRRRRRRRHRRGSSSPATSSSSRSARPR